MRLPQNVNYKLGYAKPVSLNIVGSSPLNTSTKNEDGLILDFMVKMPAVSTLVNAYKSVYSL